MRHNHLQSILIVMPAILMLLVGTTAQASEPKGQFHGARQTDYPAWFKQSFFNLKEDVAEATASGKRVMLLFSQNGCPYCNALVERNLAQKDIQDSMRKNLDVVHINMWGDNEVTGLDGKHYSEKDFAAAMKVQFTPTILFLDEQGNVVLRLNGYLPPNRFKLAIDYVTQKQEKQIGYREYLAVHQPKSMQGKLQAEPFFSQPPFDLRPSSVADKPVAVFFEQIDCPDCDTLHDKVLSDPGIRKSLEQYHAIQLDMWSQTELTTPDGKKTSARDWAKALNVQYAPTIVLFDPHGHEIIRSEAMFKVFHAHGIFDYVLSGAYRKQPSFQRWLSERADHLREQGVDVDIWTDSDEKRPK